MTSREQFMKQLPAFPGGHCAISDLLAERFANYAVSNNLAGRLEQHVLCNDHPGLPHWWTSNGNALLLPRDKRHNPLPHMQVHPGQNDPRNFCLVLNGTSDYSIMLWDCGGFLYVSESARLGQGQIAFGGGSVFIGDDVRATARMMINCRNQGIVSFDKDILIGSDVVLMTDDCHTIISIADNRRINPYGGSIFLRRHIWVADSVRIMGNSVIESDTVIGAGAFVRKIFEETGVILAGVPAQVIRRNITWDHRDLPPDLLLERI